MRKMKIQLPLKVQSRKFLNEAKECARCKRILNKDDKRLYTRGWITGKHKRDSNNWIVMCGSCCFAQNTYDYWLKYETEDKQQPQEFYYPPPEIKRKAIEEFRRKLKEIDDG